MNRQKVLILTSLGVVLLLASFVTTGAAVQNVNDPSYWEAQGYGSCQKVEGPATPFDLGSPPVDSVWTALVIKAGSSSSTETPVYLIEDPAPGSYVHPSGKDISYVIFCHDTPQTTTTVSTTSTTDVPSTTEASTTSQVTSTTTASTTTNMSTTTEATTTTAASSTTEAPTTTGGTSSSSTPTSQSPTTVESSSTTPVVDSTVVSTTSPGVLVGGTQQGPATLAVTGSSLSVLLAVGGLAILAGLAIWGVVGRLRHES